MNKNALALFSAFITLSAAGPTHAKPEAFNRWNLHPDGCKADIMDGPNYMLLYIAENGTISYILQNPEIIKTAPRSLTYASISYYDGSGMWKTTNAPQTLRRGMLMIGSVPISDMKLLSKAKWITFSNTPMASISFRDPNFASTVSALSSCKNIK